MADVAFDSNKHAQTRQDVEHGGAAIASSSEAITRLSNGQYERFWTDEAGPQALRNAYIAFLGAYGKIAATEHDTLRSFGHNVDQAIEDFAAVEQATGDELKALRDSMGDPHLTNAHFFDQPRLLTCRRISNESRSRDDGGRQRCAHPGRTDRFLARRAR